MTLLTTINPSTHHYNSSQGSDFFIHEIEQSIVPVQAGDIPSAPRKGGRQSFSVSMTSASSPVWSSIRKASSRNKLNFNEFSIGFAMEHPHVSYRLLGVPRAEFLMRRRLCLISQRVEVVHTYRDGDIDCSDKAIVNATMAIAFSPGGRGSVVDFVVGVEHMVTDDLVMTVFGADESAQKLGYDPRFTVLCDELLHMFVICDSRVFTPMVADKMIVKQLIDIGWKSGHLVDIENLPEI